MFTEKKIVGINPENCWVDNFCLKFLYLGSLCFGTSVFIMLLRGISSEANNLLILDVLDCFFYCVVVNFGKLIFGKSLFVSKSLFISRQTFSMEGKEVGIFNKAQGWISLILR